jgi:ABC-type Na+ efflux pump permease subunit
MLPAAIASYSFIGEKVQKSLEPLLATPTTDSEIIFGKSLATFIPTMIVTWAGGAIFVLMMNHITSTRFGQTFFPNDPMWIILLLLAPLTCILAIEINILISARMNDVRSAQQLGSLMFLPFMGIYVLGEIGIFTLNNQNLWIISGIMFVLAIIMFYLAKATFQREEILTRWR